MLAFFAGGPEVAVVDGAVGFGKREHGEAVVVHAVAEVAGRGVLSANDVADGLANLLAVEAEVRIFARGEEGHQGHAGDAGAVFAAGPAAGVGLCFDEILQAAVVHFANVARHDLADVLLNQLGRAGGGDVANDCDDHCDRGDM